MAKHAFDKFINKAASGAKKKEAIRQEKRKLKQEKREKIQELRNKKQETRIKAQDARNKEQGKYEVRSTKYEGKESNKEQETRDKGQDSRFKEQDSRNKKQSKYEVRSKKYEIGNQKPEIRNQKSGKHKSPTTNYSQSPADEPQPTHKVLRTNYKQQLETEDWKPETGLMPLNKFIAHAGISARREAAEIVKQGKVQVNGSVVHEPGFKVSSNDKVQVNGKQIFPQRNLVYILLNKPKDYITTAKDPEGRKTVFDLIKTATKERVYPVGRLDRNTTGVLLMTNDGELAQKLTHPSFEVKKLYEVKLDKPLAKKDFETILNGVTLEDGLVKADALAYADAKDKSIIGIEIHSGRNRIVRRLFEHLHYDVKNLDRVMFANLTKKNVDRGKWRYLREKEIRLLKYMNQSFVRSKK